MLLPNCPRMIPPRQIFNKRVRSAFCVQVNPLVPRRVEARKELKPADLRRSLKEGSEVLSGIHLMLSPRLSLIEVEGMSWYSSLI